MFDQLWKLLGGIAPALEGAAPPRRTTAPARTRRPHPPPIPPPVVEPPATRRSTAGSRRSPPTAPGKKEAPRQPGPLRLLLQVDGTPGNGRGQAGLGAVVRNERGQVLCWRAECAPAQSSNEAEYQALLLGLRLVAASVRFYFLPKDVVAEIRVLGKGKVTRDKGMLMV